MIVVLAIVLTVFAVILLVTTNQSVKPAELILLMELAIVVLSIQVTRIPMAIALVQLGRVLLLLVVVLVILVDI